MENALSQLLRLSLCSVAAWLLTACGGAQARQPQRVVLITLDTLRYDSFAAPDSKGDELMPKLRALATRGLSFDNFYANSSTTQPSHASLFTGLHPWRHGVTRNGLVLDAGLPNLVEELQRRGFATHAVISSFPLQRQFGFARGFDHFEDQFDVPYVQVWEGRPVEQGRFFSLADSVTQRALAALDAAREGDQFFWFHYFDPHDPYGDASGSPQPMEIGQLLKTAREQPESDGIELQLARAKQLYGQDVRAMDASLARLIERLEQDAQHYETHIVLTADHGESFGELGAMGHGKRVTREQVQVPLLIVSPRVEPELRADAASLVDLPRTILGLLDLDVGVFAGRDLLDANSASESKVLGMRRSFAQPKSELTSDGKEWPLDALWFFRVEGRELHSGNAKLILVEGDRERPLQGAAGQELRSLFEALELLAAKGPSALELNDEEVQRALGALGYLDFEQDL